MNLINFMLKVLKLNYLKSDNVGKLSRIVINKKFLLTRAFLILILVIGCVPNFEKDQNVLTQLLNNSKDSLIQKI